jgi:hypothetical protein
VDEIDLTDGNTKGRHVQPQGFVPSHLAEPALRDRDNQRTQLEYAATELGLLRAAADTIAAEGSGAGIADRAAAVTVSAGLLRVQRLLRALVAGALVALVAVGLSVGSARPAAAMEVPQPDPVAVSVTLTAGTVAVGVPVTTRSVDSHGRHCASAWGPTYYGRGFVGRICSRRSSFTVPVTLDSRYVPVGRSTMAVTDDVDPLATFPQVVNLTARRPSRFGVGRWLPLPQGQLYVSATLYSYTPAKGAWTPQQNSPVRVREWSAKRGRWIVKATLTTDAHGVFAGVVHLGAGPHIVDVDRLPGATVTATTGATHTFILAPEVPVDTI